MLKSTAVKWKQPAPLWSGHEDSGWWSAWPAPYFVAACYWKLITRCQHVTIIGYFMTTLQLTIVWFRICKDHLGLWGSELEGAVLLYLSLDLKESDYPLSRLWGGAIKTFLNCTDKGNDSDRTYFFPSSFIHWYICTSLSRWRAETYIMTWAPAAIPSLYLLLSLCPSCDCAE